MNEEKRKRSPNWLLSEKELLLSLVEIHYNIIENKKTDGVTLRSKMAQWNIIADEYNSRTRHCSRTGDNLKAQWESMKKVARKSAANIRRHMIQTESSRMLSSASFVGVLIVIGLPLWWKTTEVYRVALPYDKIAAFDTFSHVITTELILLANDEPTAAEITGLVEKSFEDSDVINLKITKSVLSESLRQTLDSVADEHEAVEEVASRYDLKEHNRFYLVQRKHLFQDVWLATERVMFFRDAEASTTAVEALKQWVYQTRTLRGARAEAADAARRVRLPPAPAYRVLVHAPHHSHLEDDIEDYIGSFLDELSVLHNFTLKSQSLHLLDFDFQAEEVKDSTARGRHFSVSRSRLPQLLTALEARAATSVPRQPAIELALYQVPCRVAPLVIYDEGVGNPGPIQAFLSPAWGGVVLASPSPAECRGGPWRPPARLVMGAFISHLRKLLGIADTEAIAGAHLEPLRAAPPRRWELDTLLRIRTLEQVAAAERTLQSLAQLLGEIYNIVINDEVGASINSAVESIQRARAAARAGSLVEAYGHALRAAQEAEAAFVAPSLLALLYFPDDQKYAVYIPLFLPIMFPVVLSLKNLLLWLRGKPLHKEKAD